MGLPAKSLDILPYQSPHKDHKPITIAMDAFFSPDIADVLTKMAVFLLVQALVYLILTNSSNIFSSSPLRSHSFRAMPSMRVRQMLARVSDVPVGTDEPSYSSVSAREPSSDEKAE